MSPKPILTIIGTSSLFLKLLQSAKLRHTQTGVFFLPPIKCLLCNPHLANHLSHRRARFGLPKSKRNLLLAYTVFSWSKISFHKCQNSKIPDIPHGPRFGEHPAVT